LPALYVDLRTTQACAPQYGCSALRHISRSAVAARSIGICILLQKPSRVLLTGKRKQRYFLVVGRVFDQFPRYDTKILLGDFNAKVGRENILKPTIGNESYMKLVMTMELE
jgi:hypothetical protein